MESLKAHFQRQATESKVLREKTVHCEECGEEFTAFILTVNGKDFSPLLCNSCTQEKERNELICKRCFGYMYSATLPTLPTGNKNYAICPYCEPMGKRTEFIQSLQDERERNFDRICPIEYREIDTKKLPSFRIYDELQRHNFRDPNKPSLFLFGATGTGKTRIAYQLTKKCVLQGYSVQIWPSVELSNKVSSLFLENVAEANKFQTLLSKCDLLFIDDFGKGSLSERNLSFIFAVIDYRISNRLPVIITSNDDKETLLAKTQGNNTVEPLLRRLKDHSILKVFR